mgnify:CR=1 FL=1
MALGSDETQTLLRSVRRFADEALAPDALRDDRFPFSPWNPEPHRLALGLGLDALEVGTSARPPPEASTAPSRASRSRPASPSRA